MSIAFETKVCVLFLTKDDTEKFEIVQNVITNYSAKQPAFIRQKVLVELVLGS
jgi:predicted nucleic-acid-binding protein